LERLDELNRTQWLKREELLALQRQKLYSLLTHAYQYVPYYQRLFDQYHFSPDEVLTDVTSLSRLPVLTKDLIRENFGDLQTTESRRRLSLVRKTTSGSTGHPLVFMQDGDFRDYVTADIHRHLGWAGWTLGDVHCYLWASHLELAESRSPRTRFMNWTLNRFVTNAFVLSEDSMSLFASEIRRRRPGIIFGYPSSLYKFAQFVKDQVESGIHFEAVFSSAEMMLPGQRELISYLRRQSV
jgi:phenylacetate-CoA ligase